jgi:hypothetical protein
MADVGLIILSLGFLVSCIWLISSFERLRGS